MTKHKWESDGRLLREALDRLQAKDPGATQEWLAGKLGVSQPLVGAWLAGRKPVAPQHFIALSALLEAAPEQLAPKAFDRIRNYVKAAPVILSVQESSAPYGAYSPSEEKLLARVRKLSAESGRDMAATLLLFLDSVGGRAVPDGDAKLQAFSKPEKRTARKRTVKA